LEDTQETVTAEPVSAETKVSAEEPARLSDDTGPLPSPETQPPPKKGRPVTQTDSDGFTTVTAIDPNSPEAKAKEYQRKKLEEDLLSQLDDFFGPDDNSLGDLSSEDTNTTFDNSEDSVADLSSFLDEDTIITDDQETPTVQGEVQDHAQANPIPPFPDPESEIGQLRTLLLEREISQLKHLTALVGEPQNLARTISNVITEAILIRGRQDDKLNTVLSPTVEKIVVASVRRNPETLANQIFPVIGPAIRKFISDTFISMLQSLNNTLEMSLSLKGLKWRLEAWRVHKPFSEIVLLHTLLYHVEEIYLIHAESGLILDHLVYEGGESRDPEMVAAMFTAIRDFIRDSFSVGQKENLDNLRFGERTIFLQRTEQVFMACVVRGNPPATLNRDLQDALELMVVNSADDLENFKGDPAPFAKNRHFFMPFLQAQYEEKPEKLPILIRMAPLLAILFIIAFISQYFWNASQTEKALAQEQIRQEYRIQAHDQNQALLQSNILKAIESLNREPGLALGHVNSLGDGTYEILCLKDDLARDPYLILTQEKGLSPNIMQLIVKPFASLDAPIVRQRVQNYITPPPGVSLLYDEVAGVLTLSGSAPLGWILEAEQKALALPGVRLVDTKNLTDPRMSRMRELVEEINGVTIHFPMGKSTPVPADAPILQQAVDNLVTLEKLAGEMQVTVSLVIYGHADSIGDDRRNYDLSMERTKTIAALLYSQGSFMLIRNYGMGSDFSVRAETGAPKEDPNQRKIELRVLVGSESFAPPRL
jgi:OOP family OmpA-OmpF porin